MRKQVEAIINGSELLDSSDDDDDLGEMLEDDERKDKVLSKLCNEHKNYIFSYYITQMNSKTYFQKTKQIKMKKRSLKFNLAKF